MSELVLTAVALYKVGMLWNEWVKLSVFYWITQYERFYIAS